jgi:predicted glycoside hydrolase/deacetylase ChbG (UPF0249 family)
MRRIVLCADDYGMSPGVSEGIRDLIHRGRLNATSVMTASPHFSGLEARALMAASAETPVAIGLHVTLTAPFLPLAGGKPFSGLGALLAKASLRLVDAAAIRHEIDAQMDAFIAAFGRPPDFADGHQHVHLFPVIREAFLATVTVRAPAAWVRQCGSNRPARALAGDRKGLLIHSLSRPFRDMARLAGLRTNPAFAGTYAFAAPARFEHLFAGFLDDLPDRSVIMCHPGLPDAELVELDPVVERRREEYDFFNSERFPAVLDAHGTVLA